MSKDFYIYGKKPIEEVLARNPGSIRRVYIKDGVKQGSFEKIRELANAGHVPINGIDDRQITRALEDEVNHQGVIALSKPFEYATLDAWIHSLDMAKMPTVLILDHIQDVSNLGAIIRSATAAGVAGIIVAELNQAPVTSAVYKTSAGTVGKIPLIQVGNINQTMEKLKKAGFWIVGLGIVEDKNKSTDLWKYDFTEPTAVVIGNEGDGLREKTAEHCDTIVSIVMQNEVESLNASVSAALVCYEILRQRKAK